MALRQLILNKKIQERSAKITALRADETMLKDEEVELEKALDEAETDEEVKVVVDPNIVADGVLINADITGTRNLSKDTTYILQGQINVSGVLNIEAGTIIKGDKVTKGCLVVVPGGKLNAIGTATAPIVFTSRLEPGLRAAGDWGGVVIVGKAKVNQTSPVQGVSGFLLPHRRNSLQDNL